MQTTSPDFGGKTGTEQRIMLAIRRIIRCVDLYSHTLRTRHGVTAPQLSCLRLIVARGETTLRRLADEARLSPSTVVGIVDRLERNRLVERTRSTSDRRQVLLTATSEGLLLVERTPSPLQERLSVALERLQSAERAVIAASLETIVDLLEARNIDAAPILDTARSFGPSEEA